MNHDPTDAAPRRASRADVEERWKAEAARIVTEIADVLSRHGWDFVALSIARVEKNPDGSVCAPGSSTLHIHPRISPALPSEASTLRRLADETDVVFLESGAAEATSGHVEEILTTAMQRKRRS